MENKKPLTAGLVVLLSLVGGYLIVQGSMKPMLPSLVALKHQGERYTPPSPFQTPKNSGSALNEPIKYAENANNLSNDFSEVNATQFLAGSIFSDPRTVARIKQIDPNKPSDANALRDMILGRLNASAADLQNIFDVSISDSEIKTLPDNSNGAKQAYLRALERVKLDTEAASARFQLNQANITNDLRFLCEKNGDRSSSPLFLLAQNYSDAARKTGDIPVPSDWRDVQRKVMQYAKKSSLIFQSFAECADDPMKVIIALNNTQDLAQTENALQALLNQKSQEVGYDGKF